MSIDDIVNKEEIEIIGKNIKIENRIYTKDDLDYLEVI